MQTWPCVVWLPKTLRSPSVDEFEDGVAADLSSIVQIDFNTVTNETVYRFHLDAEGEDKLRVRVGRLSQVEQKPIQCEFDGVPETIYELA